MSETTKCPICARREPSEGETVCRPCLNRIDDNLARIVELVRWASAWLSPRTGSGNTGRSVPASRPPLDIASLDAAMGNDVLPVLESWERLTREFYGLAPYGPASLSRNAAMSQGGPVTAPVTVRGCVAFLRANLARIAESVDYPIDDLATEVRELRIGLEYLDPDHERPEGIRVPCPADHPEGDGRSCSHRLPVDAKRPADDVECRRCGTVWTSGRLILVALNDPGVTIWAYPDVIEDALGIPSRTLRQWATDGHVRRNGSQYDVGAAFRRRAS